MTDNGNGNGGKGPSILTLVAVGVPIVSLLGTLIFFAYSQGGNTSSVNSQLQSTQQFQTEEITQLLADDKTGNALSYSIQSQLAQLTQSVADIKAQTGRGP